MLAKLDEIEARALELLEEVSDATALEAWRIANIGRNSPVMTVFSELSKLVAEDRPQVGQRANRIKQALEQAFARRQASLQQADLERALAAEKLDVTLPGRPVRRGRLHPATQNLRRMLAILAEMGFQTYTSREVETDEYNFQLLNIPPHHPARDLQDTFYVENGAGGESERIVLRTHTSPGQVRAMREFAAMNPEHPPSIRIAVPGMVYRHEQITVRSEVQFNQVEGLAVGEGITLADLKGTLADFARRMYGDKVRMRFRSDYFPFTEPSAELDLECFVCGGKGCPVCKQSGWLEILGSGMVHPIVLENGGYDPRRYSGFAFGMGCERQLLMRHRINDIRLFWANDVRFLEQF
jgi:phenylalanyl-tRNA synthetase alpha chain